MGRLLVFSFIVAVFCIASVRGWLTGNVYQRLDTGYRFRFLQDRKKTSLRALPDDGGFTFSITIPKNIAQIVSLASDKVADVSSMANADQLVDVIAKSESMKNLAATEATNLVGSSLGSLLSTFSALEPTVLFSGLLAVAVGGFSLAAASASNKGDPFGDGPAVYNVAKLEEYYKQRPWLILGRLIKILVLSLPFQIGLLFDWKTDNLKKNEAIRAKQALNILGNLGPTFVKLGQALSIRTDIIPDVYANELKRLQDAVPPFDNDLAKSIICKELEIKSLDEKFKTFSDKPIASASIGQVYKATLLDGREVAVKVQRPNILSEISLDLYLLRLIAPLQVIVTNLVTGEKTEEKDKALAYDLVDEWGRGLVGEVDYQQEAKNTKRFIQAMEKRGLYSVTSPQVIENFAKSKVLVTEWITGTRLDRDASADVPRLCGVALNAYLAMLLDTGVLHCDPHPGNLLRTTDGRLCILDWGMTLDLPKDLQYGLLEFIAHVNAEDFDQLPEDFVKLGASPPEKLEEVRQAGIAKGFAVIMKQLSKGGGPKGITDGLREEFKARYGDLSDDDLTQRAKEEMLTSRAQKQQVLQQRKAAGTLTTEEEVSALMASATEELDVSGMAGIMEMMSKRNRDIFKLPTYMLYVIRAFSTLEGIGLSVNPNYAILTECYPYLAKRLLTDGHPRAQQALRQMMLPNGRLRLHKLLEFSQGFQQYTSTVTSTGQTMTTAAAPAVAMAMAGNSGSSSTMSQSAASGNYNSNNKNVQTAVSANSNSASTRNSSNGNASPAAAAASSSASQQQQRNTGRNANTNARRTAAMQSGPSDLADLLFESKENNMQDLVVETAATITDSLVRFSLHRLRTSLPGQLAQLAVRAPKTMINILVPPELRPYLLPFTLPATLPYDLTQAMLKLTAANADDLSNVDSLKILLKELEPGLKQRVRSTIREMVSARSSSSTNTNSNGNNNNSNAGGGGGSSSSSSSSSIIVPLSDQDSTMVRRALGMSSKVNARVPVFLRLTRKFGATVLATAAQRMEKAARDTYTTSTTTTNNNNNNNNSNDNANNVNSHSNRNSNNSINDSIENATSSTHEVDEEDVDYEIELLLTEQIGSLTSATAKTIARVMDTDSVAMKFMNSNNNNSNNNSNKSSSRSKR